MQIMPPCNATDYLSVDTEQFCKFFIYCNPLPDPGRVRSISISREFSLVNTGLYPFLELLTP